MPPRLRLVPPPDVAPEETPIEGVPESTTHDSDAENAPEGANLAEGTDPEKPKASSLFALPKPFPHDIAWRGPLEIYRDAVGPGQESADEFHFGCAISSLGILFGRHWCIRYPYQHFPNFFVCLIGPTGAARKTAALRAALEDLIMPIGGHRIPRTMFIAQGMSGSGEGLLGNIADEMGVKGRSMLIYEDEIAVILKGLRREGSTLGAFLIQAADAVPIMTLSTRKRPLIATAPTVGMLTASTSEWVEANVIEDDIRGGIVNRILWFYGTDKASISVPTPPEPGIVSRLRKSLTWVPHAPCLRSKPMTLTSEAFEAFDAWYIAKRAIPAITPIVAAATARVHTQAIRLALLYAILDNAGGTGTSIEVEHVKAGMAVSEYCAAVAGHLFLTSSRHPDARVDRAVLEILRKVHPKPVPITRLHHQAAPDVSARHFKQLLDGLGSMQYIVLDRGYAKLSQQALL